MLAKLLPEGSTTEEYDRILLLRSLGTSLLVKVHTARQYYQFAGPSHTKRFADEVDLLVTDYRDLREESVSAVKMFVENTTTWKVDDGWSEMCRLLIKRRDSLILEALDRVPIVDVKYKDWRTASSEGMWRFISHLVDKLPWVYSEDELRSAMFEGRKMRVPKGGVTGMRIDWHVTNLMSPWHISTQDLENDIVQKGYMAVSNQPSCAQWLRKKVYVL